MTEKVLKLTDRVLDVRYQTVKETLEGALSAIDGTWKNRGYEPTRCVLIFVDERGGCYQIESCQSAGNISETIALLEIAKMCEYQNMGFTKK